MVAVVFWIVVGIVCVIVGYSAGDLAYVYILGTDKLFGYRVPAYWLAGFLSLYCLIRYFFRRRRRRPNLSALGE